MNNIGGVGFIEGGSDLTQATKGEVWMEAAFFLEDIAELFAVEELHDHKRHLGVLVDAGVGDLDNIIAFNFGGNAGFAAEAFPQLFAFEVVGVHNFEGVVALGFDVHDFINGAHSALGDASDDAVAATK